MQIRFLHLSDLHFSYTEMKGAKWTVDTFNEDMVTRSMLTKIEELISNGEKFDFIIISGDIAKYGKQEEYYVAELFCKKLLETTNLSHDRLYVVPGNHDVNRTAIKSWHLKGLYQFEEQDEITKILMDPEALSILLGKFKEFNDFASRVMNRQIFDKTTYHMVESLHIEKNGKKFRVNVMALNSSLFAGYDGDDKQKLALGLYQVERALNQLDENAILSLVFFHHPFSCLHKADRLSCKKLRGRLDLILTGHLHEPSNVEIRSSDGRALMIGAGPCYESSTSQNSFNCVEIDLTNGKGRTRFYKYLPNFDCWKKDTDVNPYLEDGDFQFTIDCINKNQVWIDPVAQSAIADLVPQVQFIHNYLLPDNFTGREEERERLNQLIWGESDPKTRKKASLISVRGFGGMGKSCLIRKIVEEFRNVEKFRYIIWFSFYEFRTKDENAFLQSLLNALSCPGLPGKKKGKGAATAMHHRHMLCRLLDSQPTLLVLDGLEVIQHNSDPTAPQYGHIQRYDNQQHYKETYQLLAHICNQSTSTALVTSRVTLSEFVGVSGYLEIPLEHFPADAGAAFLKCLRVDGTDEELIRCVDIFGGIPLFLKAAGKYMQVKHIPAKEVEKLTGDTGLFQRSSEGERMAKILVAYRAELDAKQEYFLKMLSLHPRSVTEENFTVLIKGYDRTEQSRREIMETIIDPLVQKDLISVLVDCSGTIFYSTHPLMKLTFCSWLGPNAMKQAHEQWADSIKSFPGILNSSEIKRATNLEILQPLVDMVIHYLDARNTDAAWDIYRGRNLDRGLYYLGYARKVLEISLRFEWDMEQCQWKPNAESKRLLFHYLSEVLYNLERYKESLFYNKKQYSTAKESGDNDSILRSGASQARSYFSVGQISHAQKQMVDLEKIEHGASDGWTKHIYRKIRAELFLYMGNSEDAEAELNEVLNYLPPSITNYSKILTQLVLIDTLIRSGKLPESESLLHETQKQIESHHIIVLKPKLFLHFTRLALKKNNLPLGRKYNDQRVSIEKSLGIPHQDDGFLLVREGQFDKALCEAIPHVSSPVDEKFNKVDEIGNLLIMVQACHGKGDTEQAQEFLVSATQLMEQTGCWYYKDDWEDTKKRLRARKKAV